MTFSRSPPSSPIPSVPLHSPWLRGHYIRNGFNTVHLMFLHQGWQDMSHTFWPSDSPTGKIPLAKQWVSEQYFSCRATCRPKCM